MNFDRNMAPGILSQPRRIQPGMPGLFVAGDLAREISTEDLLRYGFQMMPGRGVISIPILAPDGARFRARKRVLSQEVMHEAKATVNLVLEGGRVLVSGERQKAGGRGIAYPIALPDAPAWEVAGYEEAFSHRKTLALRSAEHGMNLVFEKISSDMYFISVGLEWRGDDGAERMTQVMRIDDRFHYTAGYEFLWNAEGLRAALGLAGRPLWEVAHQIASLFCIFGPHPVDAMVIRDPMDLTDHDGCILAYKKVGGLARPTGRFRLLGPRVVIEHKERAVTGSVRDSGPLVAVEGRVDPASGKECVFAVVRRTTRQVFLTLDRALIRHLIGFEKSELLFLNGPTFFKF